MTRARPQRMWMCALAVAAVAVTAPSAYGASGPTYLGFEGPAAGTTAPNLYPGGGVTFSVVQNSAECLDTPVVQTAQDAKTPPHQFYMPCNPTMTLRFSTPQAFVALWARSTSTAQNPIAVRGLNALGQQVATQDIAANAGWVAATLTVPTATISTVTIAGFGVVDLDDLAFSTQGPQPDGTLSQQPPAVTRSTSATFQFVGNWSGTWWQCALDGATYSQCSPTSTGTVGYSDLAEGTHTFSARTIDWYGNIDPTPATYGWRVDLTPPDTRVDQGPAALSTGTSASVAFSSPDADVAGFTCRLDGGPAEACSSPWSRSGLAVGDHRLDVTATDAAGNADASPATWQWTVQAPPVAPPVVPPVLPLLDADLDGVADSIDDCPGVANPSQADADGDHIGDACDSLPPGNVAPVVGVRTVAQADSGDVLVKLPGSAGAADGFIPLKGAASLPVGTTVDARKGRITLKAAGGRTAAVGSFSAAIFVIKQHKARKPKKGHKHRRPARVSTDLQIQTPPGLQRACATDAYLPLKGVIRTFTGQAKGLFRTIGAASATVVGSGSWIVQDRCDGTVTQVGRGSATVTSARTGKQVKVRAGQAYIVRAALFGAKQRRLR